MNMMCAPVPCGCHHSSTICCCMAGRCCHQHNASDTFACMTTKNCRCVHHMMHHIIDVVAVPPTICTTDSFAHALICQVHAPCIHCIYMLLLRCNERLCVPDVPDCSAGLPCFHSAYIRVSLTHHPEVTFQTTLVSCHPHAITMPAPGDFRQCSPCHHPVITMVSLRDRSPWNY
jgi:hypothetical protein